MHMLQPSNLGHCSKTQQHVRNVGHPQIKSNWITWIFRTSRVVNTMTVTMLLFYVFFWHIILFGIWHLHNFPPQSDGQISRIWDVTIFGPFNLVKAPFASQFIFQHQELNSLYFRNLFRNLKLALLPNQSKSPELVGLSSPAWLSCWIIIQCLNGINE